MILSIFRKKTDAAPVAAVYSSIVAQSRQSRFYAEWGVPDTVTGRFDMISLHLALLLRRLRREGAEASAFSQAVLDLFFLDMDRSLRELGVGDLSVGKKVRKMSEVFYGLLASLDGALQGNDSGALEGVLARNIYAGIEGANPEALAAHVRSADARLQGQAVAAIVAGNIDFGEF